MIDPADYRDRFPILSTCTYLINHSLAAMPAAAEERVLEYTRMWRERGIRSWGEGWWDMAWTVGDQLGRIMGAPPDSIVMHQNVTVAEAVVLSCFASARRTRTGSSTKRRTSRRCATLPAQPHLEVAAVEDDAAIVDAIDERTLLVPISHVLFKNGEIQDIEPIVRRAHEAGAHVILDCYQSAGIVPSTSRALGVDFAVGGSVKWLCGGPGAGWLYVRPDLAERLEPRLVGWQGHARPFAFEPELEYAAIGARRFLTGTPNVPALYAATAGYDVIEEVGVPAIRERSLGLAPAPDRRGATRAGLRSSPRASQSAAEARSPSRPPNHPGVHKELGERGVICDSRPDPVGGVRIGAHFFNTEDEVRHAVAELADIVAFGRLRAARRRRRAVLATDPPPDRFLEWRDGGAATRTASRSSCPSTTRSSGSSGSRSDARRKPLRDRSSSCSSTTDRRTGRSTTWGTAASPPTFESSSTRRTRGRAPRSRTALADARLRFSAIFDADLEYDPHDLAVLLRAAPAAADNVRVVYGVRTFDGYTSHSFLSSWATQR